MSSSSTQTTTLASTSHYATRDNPNNNYAFPNHQQQSYFSAANGKGPPSLTTTSLATLDNNKFHTNSGYGQQQQHPQTFLHVKTDFPHQQQQQYGRPRRRLSGCAQCLRWLVFMLNFIFWLTGFALVGFALWLRFDPALKDYMDLDEQVDYYYSAAYLLMGAGAITAVLGFLGCCGALRKSTCLLATFIMILIVIFGTELAAGVLAYLRSMELRPFMERQMRTLIHEQYAQPQFAQTTRYIDLLQSRLRCCGAVSPMDWHESIYGGPIVITAAATRQRDLGVLGAAEFYLPGSCCTPAFRATSRTNECMQIPPSIRAAARRRQQANALFNNHSSSYFMARQDVEEEENRMLRNFTGIQVSFTQTDFLNGGGTGGGGMDGISTRFYRLGCVDRLAEQLDYHLQAICAVGLGLAMLQLLQLVFTMVLMCALKTELQDSQDENDDAPTGDVIFAVQQHHHAQAISHNNTIPTTFIAAPMMINDRNTIYAVPPALIQLHTNVTQPQSAAAAISLSRRSSQHHTSGMYDNSSSQSGANDTHGTVGGGGGESGSKHSGSRNRESLAESSGGGRSSSSAVHSTAAATTNQARLIQPNVAVISKSNTLSYTSAAAYRPSMMNTPGFATTRRAPSAAMMMHNDESDAGGVSSDYRHYRKPPSVEENNYSASAYYGITKAAPNSVYSSSTLATSTRSSASKQQQQQLLRQAPPDHQLYQQQQQQQRFVPQYRNQNQQLFTSYQHQPLQQQIHSDERLHRL